MQLIMFNKSWLLSGCFHHFSVSSFRHFVVLLLPSHTHLIAHRFRFCSRFCSWFRSRFRSQFCSRFRPVLILVVELYSSSTLSIDTCFKWSMNRCFWFCRWLVFTSINHHFVFGLYCHRWHHCCPINQYVYFCWAHCPLHIQSIDMPFPLSKGITPPWFNKESAHFVLHNSYHILCMPVNNLG